MLPLAVRARGFCDARILTPRDIALGPEEDLQALRKAETAFAEDAAGKPGVAAAVVSLDMATWRLVRLVLARDAIETTDALAFEVAHLARPGWGQLSKRS